MDLTEEIIEEMKMAGNKKGQIIKQGMIQLKQKNQRNL